MRVLAVDVGTGTQDILLFDSELELENCVQMVVPSPTQLVARQIRAATAAGEPIFLTGVTMGGGPCAWAAEDHLRAGLPVFATPAAAQTFDDDLAKVEKLGVRLVDAPPLGARRVEMRDFDLPAILASLRAFGIVPELDAIAVAVFDHGAAPPDVSDRTFRFEYIAETVARNDLAAFAYLREEIPVPLTRMAAVAASTPADLPLLVMDTGPAAVLGALEDAKVRDARSAIVVNVGNFHTLAFHLERSGEIERSSDLERAGDTEQSGEGARAGKAEGERKEERKREGDGKRVLGLFEHHTGELRPDELESYLRKLADGTISNAEVFADMGHGALVVAAPAGPPELLAVVGPRRSLLAGSALRPYFAVPHGDMMLAGCFGLLRALSRKRLEWRSTIERSLDRGAV